MAPFSSIEFAALHLHHARRHRQLLTPYPILLDPASNFFLTRPLHSISSISGTLSSVLMPIQFGIPSTMSTHSGTSSSRGDCRECVRKRCEGHRNAREPKFCPKHQCPYKDAASGEMCKIRKKGADARCQTHTQCKVHGCQVPRAADGSGILTEYCGTHKCIIEDCDEGRAHNPTRGTYNDLCAIHLSMVCKIPTCSDWQFNNGNYCVQHTCIIERCGDKNLSEGGRPFCIEHNKCNVEGCQKPRCEFGSRFEVMCRDHYVPPCLIESCGQQSSPGTRYCDLHSCRYTNQKRCEKEARPGRGKPFCVDHKCSDHDCQSLRSFSEIEGSLRMNAFCPEHECRENACVKHNVPDKPYCNSHCCTDEGCTRARDRDLRCGTLCYDHHQERVTTRAVEERLAELRLKQEQEAADRAEEEARRQARRREEDLRAEREQHERRERRAPAADAGRPEPRRPARSPPRRQYPGQEGLRPRRGQAYEDEGYRSNRSSGGSFTVNDGW